jgi:ribonuclease G
MTRQNVTDGPREVMTRRCPTCDGDGIVVSDATTALEIERKLRALVTPGGRAKAFKVELNSKTAALVAGPAASRLRELEETTKRRFFLVGRDDLHLDHFRLLEQGTVDKLQPETSVHAGQEVTLKLGQVDLHDPRSAVGTVDGLDVAVAGAAKLVGKKVPARITAVLEGVAYAELLDRGPEPEPPITAEAEAEKPTRARRPAAKKAEEPEAEQAEEGPVEEEAEAEAVAEDGELEPAAPKKRTRRGTRGGRNRRKKPAAAEGESEPGAEPAPEEPDESQPEPEPAPALPAAAPVIHLPSPDLGRTDGEAENGDEPPAPARKRTRRGSRGGRNRKKKTTTVDGGAVAGEDEATAEDGAVAVAVEEEQPAEDGAVAVEDGEPAEGGAAADADEAPAEAPAEPDTWSYTPMSEWDGIDEHRD